MILLDLFISFSLFFPDLRHSSPSAYAKRGGALIAINRLQLKESACINP